MNTNQELKGANSTLWGIVAEIFEVAPPVPFQSTSSRGFTNQEHTPYQNNPNVTGNTWEATRLAGENQVLSRIIKHFTQQRVTRAGMPVNRNYKGN